MLWNIPNGLAYIHIIWSSRYLNIKSTEIRTIFIHWTSKRTQLRKNKTDPFRKMSYDDKSKTFFIHFWKTCFSSLLFMWHNAISTLSIGNIFHNFMIPINFILLLEYLSYYGFIGTYIPQFVLAIHEEILLEMLIIFWYKK